ncbi:F-box protein At3g12350 isoform X2 [Vitis vinifera]|uniref:F-box protein At3g12350 isoform X2 n=1 Tax=Vitis vinifera TaxID=29760 RepID=UPI00053F5DB8|nr:F-box protein At3g12350 isoform X2 [Vitis vinifera]|eukprot:XP_010664505.1 PREDICTED: F-box protein At3g12350 isoform X2 [Vitis vinifera]
MSNLTTDAVTSVSFSDFPEDVQLCILSFLTPSEIATFACTSKRFLSLCTCDSKLWFTLCDRRWGSKTQIKKWGSGKITYRLLYRTLIEWENLIGFWRRSGQVTLGVASPPLIFFEWCPSFIIGSRVSPSRLGTYHVIKAPFLCMSITPEGETMNFLDPDGKIESSEDFVNAVQAGFLENDLIPVHVSFMGKNHVVVEENLSFTSLNSQEPKNTGFRRSSSSGNVRAEDIGVVEDMIGAESGSPGSLPDRFMSEIYQYFANRTSPGGERASRRQRKREKARQGRRKWMPEHFVKIVNCSPTPSRPLQGLWKYGCWKMMDACGLLITAHMTRPPTSHCRVYLMIRTCTFFLWHMMTLEALPVEQLGTHLNLCLVTPLYFGLQKLHF